MDRSPSSPVGEGATAQQLHAHPATSRHVHDRALAPGCHGHGQPVRWWMVVLLLLPPPPALLLLLMLQAPTLGVRSFFCRQRTMGNFWSTELDALTCFTSLRFPPQQSMKREWPRDARTPSSVAVEGWGRTSSFGYPLWWYLWVLLQGLLWPFLYSMAQELLTLCYGNVVSVGVSDTRWLSRESSSVTVRQLPETTTSNRYSHRSWPLNRSMFSSRIMKCIISSNDQLQESQNSNLISS